MAKRQSATLSQQPTRTAKRDKHRTILGDYGVENFLSNVWQKELLLIPSAYPDAPTLITRKELLQLAGREEVDSRLVMCNKKQNLWQSSEGPFRASELARFPPMNWTLLVQAVDHCKPSVAALLNEFSFLPHWRLDDIMVSLASQGGGVGPHFDYYDVFLLQASGRRRWQLGQRCDESTPLRKQVDMKLLKTFTEASSMTLEPGDMLYVPAGLAHWGTALSDDCITISIGFRAASQRELLQIGQHHLGRQLTDDKRFRDTRLSIDKDNYCINATAAQLALQVWQQLNDKDVEQALARALGEYATEPRHPENIQCDQKLTLPRLKKRIDQGDVFSVLHHPASRFAYRRLDKREAELYVDGETHLASLSFAKAVCHLAFDSSLFRHKREQYLFVTLVNQGSLMLDTQPKKTRFSGGENRVKTITGVKH